MEGVSLKDPRTIRPPTPVMTRLDRVIQRRAVPGFGKHERSESTKSLFDSLPRKKRRFLPWTRVEE